MATDSFPFLTPRFTSIATIACQGLLACTIEADPVSPDITGTQTSALTQSTQLGLDSLSSRPVGRESIPRWIRRAIRARSKYKTLASTGTTGRELALSFSCELGPSTPGPMNGICVAPYGDGCAIVSGPDGAAGSPPDWLQWEFGGEANGEVHCFPQCSTYARLDLADGPLLHLPAMFAGRSPGSVRAYVEYSIGSPSADPIARPNGSTTLAIQQHMEDGSWQDLAQRPLYGTEKTSPLFPTFVPQNWRWAELSTAVEGGTEVRLEIRGEGTVAWRAVRAVRLFGQECVPNASNRENCL